MVSESSQDSFEGAGEPEEAVTEEDKILKLDM